MCVNSAASHTARQNAWATPATMPAAPNAITGRAGRQPWRVCCLAQARAAVFASCIVPERLTTPSASGHRQLVVSSGAALAAAHCLRHSAPMATRKMTKAEVHAFIAALAAEKPEPQTELLYTDPFSLLVSVVLSAQTTDAAVNKVTPALFAAAPTPAAMAALGAEGIGPHIRTIGLWHGKARNVAALAEILVRKHGGRVPADRTALEALPGVGRKTANVVLNVVFGEATMAVDTHIFRIGNRTGLAPGKTPREV